MSPRGRLQRCQEPVRRLTNHPKEATNSLKSSRKTLFAIKLVVEPLRFLEQSRGGSRVEMSPLSKTLIFYYLRDSSSFLETQEFNYKLECFYIRQYLVHTEIQNEK